MTFVSGTINGHSIEGLVRSSHRVQQLCSPSQTLTLTMSPEYPHTIKPSHPVLFYESGVKVFTGYVVRESHERPSYNWIVESADSYTKVSNTFISDKLTTGFDENDNPIPHYEPQSSYFWIGYLCGLAGISYTIDSGDPHTVPVGVQLGLRTVHDALRDVMAYSAQASYVDANGTLHFFRVARNSPNKTITNPVEISDEKSDEFTRNEIMVFGYASDKNRVFSDRTVGVAGIRPNRIAVVGSPMIQTQAEADRVADYLIGELGSLSRVVTAKIAGNPHLHVGQVARIKNGGLSATDTITSLDVRIDDNGYFSEVTIGERCPRIAGWSELQSTVYAGTTNPGVYRSVDNGMSWADFNNGLPVGRKYVSRIASNPDGSVMAIVNGGLYYTDGLSAWTPVILPAPINSAGDSPAPGYGNLIAVDGNGAGYDVLTTNYRSSGSSQQQARSWVYESTSGSGDWTSVELYDTDTVTSGSTIDPTTGSGYHVIGFDLDSSSGAPAVIATSGSVYSFDIGVLYKGDFSRLGILHDDSGPRTCDPFANRGILDYYVKDMRMSGAAGSRQLQVDFSFIWNDADLSFMTFYYRIMADDLQNVNTGPYIVGGPFPTIPELVTPAQPPWPFSLTFHDATLQINEVDVIAAGINDGRFIVGFMTLANSRVDASHHFEIINGDPRSCDEWIIENPDANGITRYFLNAGFIQSEFP